MRLVRAILVFVVAVSLAMLPIGISAAGPAMSTAHTQPNMYTAGQTDMSMDCCPDDMKGQTSQTDGYKCGMGFCCVGGAATLGDLGPLAFEFFAVAASKIAIPADQVVSFRGSSPPFRPPRV